MGLGFRIVYFSDGKEVWVNRRDRVVISVILPWGLQQDTYNNIHVYPCM